MKVRLTSWCKRGSCPLCCSLWIPSDYPDKSPAVWWNIYFDKNLNMSVVRKFKYWHIVLATRCFKFSLYSWGSFGSMFYCCYCLHVFVGKSWHDVVHSAPLLLFEISAVSVDTSYFLPQITGNFPLYFQSIFPERAYSLRQARGHIPLLTLSAMSLSTSLCC